MGPDNGMFAKGKNDKYMKIHSEEDLLFTFIRLFLTVFDALHAIGELCLCSCFHY